MPHHLHYAHSQCRAAALPHCRALEKCMFLNQNLLEKCMFYGKNALEKCNFSRFFLLDNVIFTIFAAGYNIIKYDRKKG